MNVYDDNGKPLVAMHWQYRFNNMVGRYNDIYRVQMANITPHVCRHTYCSNMAKSGMNPKTRQFLMGHSDISLTMNIYTHVNFDDAEEDWGDKETGVNYLYHASGYAGGLTVLLDKDGKPVITPIEDENL